METTQMAMDVFNLLVLTHVKETSQAGIVLEETRHLQLYARQFAEMELLLEMRLVMMEMILMEKDACSLLIQWHAEETSLDGIARVAILQLLQFVMQFVEMEL